MWKEFKAFALKGNMIDLAVGVIIGAAFGKIVTSIVNDLIMPLVGLLTGAKNFENMFVVLKQPDTGVVVTTIEEAKAANIPTLNYGLFISNVMDFLIIAIVIFLMVKLITTLKDKSAALLDRKNAQEATQTAPTTKTCPYCRTMIDVEATRCPHCTSMLEEK